MYGKLFESCFEGSMVGLGAPVFALWSYILAKAKFGMVDLHPRLVSAAIGMTEQEFNDALGTLSAPDERSRNPAEGGRRIVQRGPLQWEIVSWELYESFKSTEGHRAYMREAQQRHRAKKKAEAAAPSVTERDKPLRNAKSRIARAAKWKVVPDEWQPRLEHRELALAQGVDFEEALSSFRDHEFTAAKTDADRAFNNWIKSPYRHKRQETRRAPQTALERQLARVEELRAKERANTVEVAAEVRS